MSMASTGPSPSLWRSGWHEARHQVTQAGLAAIGAMVGAPAEVEAEHQPITEARLDHVRDEVDSRLSGPYFSTPDRVVDEVDPAFEQA